MTVRVSLVWARTVQLMLGTDFQGQKEEQTALTTLQSGLVAEARMEFTLTLGLKSPVLLYLGSLTTLYTALAGP